VQHVFAQVTAMGFSSQQVVHPDVPVQPHGAVGPVPFGGPPTVASSGHVPGGKVLEPEKIRLRFFCDSTGMNCESSDKWGGPSRQRIEGGTQPVLSGMQPDFHCLALQFLHRDANSLVFKKSPSRRMLNLFI